MKPISIHVSEAAYQEFKSLAARQDRPVAELVRQAMAEYIQRGRKTGGSLLEMRPHRSGRLRKGWTRVELLDEMRGR